MFKMQSPSSNNQKSGEDINERDEIESINLEVTTIRSEESCEYRCDMESSHILPRFWIHRKKDLSVHCELGNSNHGYFKSLRFTIHGNPLPQEYTIGMNLNSPKYTEAEQNCWKDTLHSYNFPEIIMPFRDFSVSVSIDFYLPIRNATVPFEVLNDLAREYMFLMKGDIIESTAIISRLLVCRRSSNDSNGYTKLKITHDI